MPRIHRGMAAYGTVAAQITGCAPRGSALLVVVEGDADVAAGLRKMHRRGLTDA
jgi:hypothetical protein